MAQAKALGYASVSVIGHDESTVEADQIGQNCLVLEGRSIQPGARIADDVWVFTGAHVGHHAQIRAHAWLASGAVVGGGDREATLASGRLSLNWQPTAKDFVQLSSFWQGDSLLAQGRREAGGG